MASIRKRGSKWQVQVRRYGLPAVNRTFTAKEDAVRWAREQDRAIDRGESFPAAPSETRLVFLSDLLDRYAREISTRKRGSMDRYQLRPLARALGHLSLLNLKPRHLTDYRHSRLDFVSPTTVAKEMVLLCHVLKVAADEWGYAVQAGKFRAVSKPSPSTGRTRRLEEGEGDRLLQVLSACRNPLPSQVFRFALATGMRRGEILSLVWSNIDLKKRIALLPITKNGEPRQVPLSKEAINTLLERKMSFIAGNASQDISGLVFPIAANAFRLCWERAKKRANINDLRFHDLRHEAITRYFELGLNIAEVTLISGHKDSRMLLRYVHLQPSDVAKKIDTLTSQVES
jgi:integrase